ncbi:DRTGG domain-containing protein [Facklamia miroungae]|uniref:Predicted transcriptional regulator containing CBS domains n=1 Tax=Facklamia miroungae TaxID=120956 RepID=A0A1G7R332_9LACT|nr:DRTGG domain-containing protein [Facklamia miroungae]NKZ29166.1 CBS domain-containing protein [Facklamia miroungae]SDG05172.1 Predicted transcriptional regulator containing CBS domains [Facklamia miroungae]
MGTKHDRIIQYIQSLPIGNKISVRGIAKQLQVSEGTAYRAIKDAEEKGLVSTIERVGTIRIEQKNHLSAGHLTFRDIIPLIDGEVLGGQNGLDKPLTKFIIGAMTLHAMERYFESQTLIIVGNRSEVHRHSLKHGIAVLITGGFETDLDVIRLANQQELPIISTSYDTFTVASLINQSINEQMIKQEIVTVEQVYTPIESTVSLEPSDTIENFKKKSNETGLSRFPVVTNNRLVGVVTANDLMGRGNNVSIERAMSKNVITVKPHMSLASVSYKMIWEDIEMIPVVADNLQLLGVVSRQDVMKALQNVQQQPQTANTFEHELLKHLVEVNRNDFKNRYDYQFKVQPQMVNHLGTLSYGGLCELIAQVAIIKVKELTGHNNILESLNLNYFTFIQLGNLIDFQVEISNYNRRSAISQVRVYVENILVAQATVGTQMVNKRQKEFN